MLTYIAVDQYGTVVKLSSKSPRKELLELLGKKHATKMYIDRDGGTYHAGYVIADRWFTLYDTTLRAKEV